MQEYLTEDSVYLQYNETLYSTSKYIQSNNAVLGMKISKKLWGENTPRSKTLGHRCVNTWSMFMDKINRISFILGICSFAGKQMHGYAFILFKISAIN